MVNRKIQMKNWNGSTWDNLFPYTITENVYDINGVDLETNLTNVINNFNEKNSQIETNLSNVVDDFNEKTTKISNEVESLKEIWSNINHIEVLGQTVTTINSGAGSRFPQSIKVDIDDNRYYVARQTSGRYNDQMIYEYNLSTNELINSKPLPVANWVYVEGLPMFKKTNGDVCFILPIERAGKFGVYNYTNNVLELEFFMEGSFKTNIDNNGKYFICSKHGDYSDNQLNATINGVLIYDLQSVISGSPVLVNTVLSDEITMTNPKVQTIAMYDDKIILGRGSTKPSLTVMNLYGETIENIVFDVDSLINFTNGNTSGSKTSENEGLDIVKVNDKWHIVSGVTLQGKLYLLKHGVGTEIKRGLDTFENGSSYLMNSPIGQMFNTNVFNAKLRVEASQNVYTEILKLKSNGIYPFFASGSATNMPIGGRSLRGTIQVDRFVDAPSILSIIAQDFSGSVWSNYYDDTASGWLGWRNIGGKRVEVSGSTFDPLSNSVQDGFYETQSGVNAPTNTGNFGTIREYNITTSGGVRKQVICTNNDANGSDTFINTRKTDGTWTGWKRFTLTSV